MAHAATSPHGGNEAQETPHHKSKQHCPKPVLLEQSSSPGFFSWVIVGVFNFRKRRYYAKISPGPFFGSMSFALLATCRHQG